MNPPTPAALPEARVSVSGLTKSTKDDSISIMNNERFPEVPHTIDLSELPDPNEVLAPGAETDVRDQPWMRRDGLEGLSSLRPKRMDKDQRRWNAIGPYPEDTLNNSKIEK